ncbi:HNH endonuclease family protein, partial [Pararhodospirillum oryzae]|uniref:hypothetical protein n=1 Tax=Pararhodospirillum oryzae TaxID=478448 RepID=UPI001C3F70B6
MHKLDRTRAPVPECLEQYKSSSKTWEDLGSRCKKEVRHSLKCMQGLAGYGSHPVVLCAYCEGSLDAGS